MPHEGRIPRFHRPCLSPDTGRNVLAQGVSPGKEREVGPSRGATAPVLQLVSPAFFVERILRDPARARFLDPGEAALNRYRASSRALRTTLLYLSQIILAENRTMI